MPRCWALAATVRPRIKPIRRVWVIFHIRLVSDFHPKGEMCKAYGLWNEERGVPKRAVIIVDKDGVIKYRKEYPAPTIPDPALRS